MWILKNRFLAFLSALLILMAGSGICSAAEIVVHNGESIQAAIDNGGNGSTIIIEPGTYNEDISINEDFDNTLTELHDITIKSSTGKPDDVVIKGLYSALGAYKTINIKLKGITFTCEDYDQTTSVGGSYSSFTVEKCKFIHAGFTAGREADAKLIDNTFVNCKYAIDVGEWGSITGKDNTFIDCSIFVDSSPEEISGFELKNSTKIRTEDSGKQVITIIPIINMTYPNGSSEIPVNPPANNTTNNTPPKPEPTPTPTPTPTDPVDNGGSSGGSHGSSHSSGGGSSGGSSGGASGGSPEPAKNVASKDTTKVFVPNGKSVTFNFTNQVTVVNFITFESEKTAGKVTAITEDLKNKSSLVSDLPEGEIYKSFNVWVGNAGYGESENILNATLNFKVEKSWMDEKNVDSSAIVLYKYDSEKKEWIEIPVVITDEDDQYVYFKADVPGFSSFAIVGKDKVQLAEEPAIGEVMASDNETIIKTNAVEKSPGFGMIGGVFCLLGLFLYRRR